MEKDECRDKIECWLEEGLKKKDSRLKEVTGAGRRRTEGWNKQE
jgi:hypothetical protein